MRNRKRRNDAFLPAALLLTYYVVSQLLQSRLHPGLLFAGILALVLFREHFDNLLTLGVLALCSYDIVMAFLAFGNAAPLELLIRLFGAFFALLLLLCLLLPAVLPTKPFLCIMGVVGLGASVLPLFLEREIATGLLGQFRFLPVLSPFLYYAGLLFLGAYLLEPLVPFRSRGSLVNSPADPGRMLFLSFISLGLYRVVWQYRLCTDVGILKGQRNAAMRDSLCLSFVPFYGAYWYYIHALPRVRAAHEGIGSDLHNEPFLFLLFSIPGLGLINQVLLQQELNSLALQHFVAAPKKNNVRSIKRAVI